MTTPIDEGDASGSEHRRGDDERFSPEVTGPVIAHMNADHGDDMVLICSAIGGVNGVVSAQMVDLDRRGGDFVAVTRADGSDGGDPSNGSPPGAGGTVPVRIPWSGWLAERSEIRTELVRLVQEAQGAP
ncbi:MAG: DUF2470 domain-containing protein [Microthrixaceae bacterium]